MTTTIAIHRDTYMRLQHILHMLESERAHRISFDDAVKCLLDNYENVV